MPEQQYPAPAWMPDHLRSELRSFYDEACHEMEEVNELKPWTEEGPCPFGFYHPIDMATLTIEVLGHNFTDLAPEGATAMDPNCEIRNWLVHS